MKPKLPPIFLQGIEMVKKSARIDDKPMAFFIDKSGKPILSLLAVSGKEEIKFTLYTLVKSLGLSEIVFINECFFVGTPAKSPKDIYQQMPISQNPLRKEAFVVNYFSKGRIEARVLPFARGDPKKDKGKGNANSKGEILIWENNEMFEKGDYKSISSTFNPFEMTEEDMMHLAVSLDCKIIREKGSKERINLPFGT